MTVVDEKGQPASGLVVKLEIGRARYSLAPDFDRWFSIDTIEGKTDAAGKCAFQVAADGAELTAWVRKDKTFGITKGAGDLTVKLAATGKIKGVLGAKKNQLKGLRIWVSAGDGLEGKEGFLEASGAFEASDLPPGTAQLHVMQNNWGVSRAETTVEAGKNKEHAMSAEKDSRPLFR